jgi:hypothetical protein
LPRRKNQLYSPGEINKLIDALLHPAARKDPRYWIVDTVFHGVVEQDPGLTLKKFMRYTMPKILWQLAEEDSTRKRNAY